ncbi:lysine--tRNA ligase [Candidatus Woesearchaeota archaeon]|nr:lysine--tRNA ligase [Candidatus Woesearchaeota archaeon]
MEDDNRLIQERRKKRAALIQEGINPYPYRFQKKHDAAAIKETYKGLKPEEATKDVASIAGRIMTMRIMGKASFCTIQDQTGTQQLYVTRDALGEEGYGRFKKLDLGDIIGAEGTVFSTRTGEVTVHAKKVVLLCKSLRPLPEKHHGLKDTELRYRQRYVDLIVNPEVRETFIKRSKIIQSMKRTLEKHGFLEVETPTLQPIYGGANARPFTTHHHALDVQLYLRISNELYLKRLLVGGYERVYEFVKDFRNEGIDRTHNPEFTQVEWYQAYADYNDGMALVEEVISTAAKDVLGTTNIAFQGTKIDLSPPWRRLSVADAVKRHAGIDVKASSREDLLDYCDKHGIAYDASSWGMLVMAVFEASCEDKLVQPTFVMDYPVESTPLAKPHRSGDERFVERFELYINGWELGNAYSELNDPVVQRRLLEEQVERGRAGEDETHPMDDDFVAAIEYGMPPTSGVGIGVDRLVMLLTDNASIRDVILFPTMKPQEDGR